MKEFLKPVRIGTLVLVGAVICLVDVGPSEQPGQDPAELLTSIESIVWIGACLLLLLLGCIQARMLSAAPMDSFVKNLAYAGDCSLSAR